MKKILVVLCLSIFCAAFTSAQSFTDEKLSVSVDLGAGCLFGSSNLSSYGVDYRGEYNSGFSGNIKASYLFGKAFQAGVKFNLFEASENFSVAEDVSVADDVELYYIALQIGFRNMFTDKWCMEYMIGAGYMHYKSKSLYDTVDRECTKGFFGANADITITRHLYRNLYMGANISVMGGKASSFKEKAEGVTATVDLDKWNRIKVLRADFALTIKVLL